MITTDRPPMAFHYCRVSHQYSAATGLSAEAQHGLCRQYYEIRQLQKQGVQWFEGRRIYDPAISARHTPFLERPMGGWLHDQLRPGDHVIFAHMDRGFRAVLDWAALIDVWQRKRIIVHVADMGVDLSTGPGMMIANIMASVAQGHSDMLSERNKAIAATLRKLNRPRNGVKPPGYKVVGKRGKRRYAADELDRAVMSYIEYHIDKKGLSLQQVADAVNRKFCKWQKRRFVKSQFQNHRFSRQRVHLWYRKWKTIQAEEATVATAVEADDEAPSG